MQQNNIIPGWTTDPLAVLSECRGYYRCPRSADGAVQGPLVGYAARYDGVHQWVGFEYANFAMAEEHPRVLRWCAARLTVEIISVLPLTNIDALCGMPEGGKALGVALSLETCRRYIFAERETIAVKTETSREKSRLLFSRHRPKKKERVVIVEDVVNNMSSADELIQRIHEAGATVQAVTCFLNRSPDYNAVYPSEFGDIPIVNIIRRIIPEYRQDDPAVAAEVAKGNVVWKPKDEWEKLEVAVQQCTR